MITAKTIIEKALSYIGTYDGGNNDVIFNTNYYGKRVSGSAYPWCCAFVWDIFRMCKAEKLFCNGEKKRIALMFMIGARKVVRLLIRLRANMVTLCSSIGTEMESLITLVLFLVEMVTEHMKQSKEIQQAITTQTAAMF